MNETHRVVVHPSHPWGVPESLARIPGVQVITPPDLPTLSEALADPRSEILVSFIWTDECLALGLKWMQSISSGLDHYPLEDLAAAGIRLTSGRGANAAAVAEHAFGPAAGGDQADRQVGAVLRSPPVETGHGVRTGGQDPGSAGTGDRGRGDSLARQGLGYGSDRHQAPARLIRGLCHPGVSPVPDRGGVRPILRGGQRPAPRPGSAAAGGGRRTGGPGTRVVRERGPGVRLWTPTRWWLRWTTGSCEGRAWMSPFPSLLPKTLRCGAIPRWCSLPIWEGSRPSTPIAWPTFSPPTCKPSGERASGLIWLCNTSPSGVRRTVPSRRGPSVHEQDKPPGRGGATQLSLRRGRSGGGAAEPRTGTAAHRGAGRAPGEEPAAGSPGAPSAGWSWSSTGAGNLT